MHQQDQYLGNHRSHNGWVDDLPHQLGYKLKNVDNAASKRGKLVTFYKNGDPNFKGLITSVSQKLFGSFDALLDWLNEKIPTPAGVNYIFLLPDKLQVTDISEMVNGRSYLVSSTKRIIRETYGNSKEKPWHNRPPSVGAFRKGETSKLLENGRVRKSRSFPSSRADSQKSLQSRNIHTTSDGGVSEIGLVLAKAKPKVFTLISNTHRNSTSKVILNPRTNQSYEEVLADISEMLVLEYPPVSSLWTVKKPVKKVNGFSHLLRGLKSHDSFLAVGQEAVPFEADESQTYEKRPQPRILQQHIDHSEDDYYQPKPKRHNRIPKPKVNNYYKPSPRYVQGLNGYNEGHPRNNRYYNDQEPNIISLAPNLAPRVRHSPIKTLPQSPAREDTPVEVGPELEELSQYKHLPYHRPYEERESVSVYIHGFPRKFYTSRFGQHEPDGSKPKRKLSLDWVYGYRGRDMRNNLVILPTEELVYFVSGVGIVYDVKNNQQRHYMEHDEDITCIALHPDRAKPKIATGQTASHVSDEAAHIRVWDPLTLVTYAVVGMGEFTKSIGSVGFSTQTDGMDDGSLLMAVDEGEKHVMSVWNWQIDRLVAKTTTSTDTVVWGQFHPHDHTTIVTFGKNHVFFWKLFWDPQVQAEGKILRDKKSGLFEADYLPKFVTSMTFSSSGDVITGDSNGRVVVWETNHENAFVYNATLSSAMRNAHSKSVFVLCMLDDGTLISGGGHDIKCWDSLNGYKLIREKEVSSDYGFVRTVAPVPGTHGDTQLFVGTTQNCILHGTLRDIFEPLVMGPYEELWALACHPDDYTFVTAGVDQEVRKWDALSRTLLWESKVEKPCLSLDMGPTGSVIALGTTVGRFIVLSGLNGMHVFSMQVGKAQLGVVKFSPEGDYVAIGSHDTSIFIYEVEDEGRVFRRHGSGVLKGHKNFVTHIDWSKNGRHLRTVSGDYDLCFWSVGEMRQVAPKTMRNEEWYTENCVLTYNHLGAWSNLSEGGDINTVDMAHKKDVLAVGENMGAIRLYKYPSTAERPYFYEEKKYSGHVTKVAFTFDDNFLITCGGRDAGILQWAVINANQRN